MKKLLAIILALVCLVGVVGCSDEHTDTADNYSSDYDYDYDYNNTSSESWNDYTSSDNNLSTSSAAEQDYNSDVVKYISDRDVDYYQADKKFTVFFGLKNSAQTLIDASGKAEITIKDNDGKNLYSKTISFTENDFSTWSSTKWTQDKYLCGLDIKQSALKHASSSYGTLTLKVTLSDGYYFDDYNMSIYDLPQHEWKDATCTSAKKCKTCGATSGSAQGHDYLSDGKCYRCGKMDPTIQNAINKCSLKLPSLPKTVSYYGYSNKLYSSVKVTAITYKFDCDSDGRISLDIYFSGTKLYDYEGSGQSSSCKIGWKLYGPDGSVVETDTFYSPSIAMGESFSKKEESVLSSWDGAEPGAYRLEIMDVN